MKENRVNVKGFLIFGFQVTVPDKLYRDLRHG